MRREVADRLIAPVVAQPTLYELRIVHELMDREQLHRGHTEPLQVPDGGGMRQPGVGAAQLLGHVGVQLGEPLDVDLVEDRVGHRPARSAVIAPVELLSHQHRARHVRRRIVFVGTTRVIGRMTEDRRVPLHLAGDRAGIRVEQQLRGIAASARSRVPRAVHAKAVALPGCYVRQVALPHEPVPLLEAPARLLARIIEHAQLDRLRHAAEQSKARAAAVMVRAERRRLGVLEHPACRFNRHQLPPST